MPIIDRYRIDSKLASGGFGVVYRATDRVTGEEVALKRLLDSRVKTRTLFEQEFSLLSQLRHPRIIAVHDFGVDDEGPFYTMELLDHGDLTKVAPLPYREACRHLRDIASSLALLHVRRLIHRDVTPRNVRFGADGRCKLIDFGGMTAFGVPRNLVGTPACIPPEAFHGMPLDQRADLYALGAVAYFLLTGHHAYSVRHLQGLLGVWSSPVPPPSHDVAEIPAALDALVMSLLAHDPLARPASAAEVIDRFTAIAGLPPDAEHDTERSYLARVALVGRRRELDQVRLELSASRKARGGVVTVQGLTGLGVSRFLDEIAVEAQLRGATVVRAAARAGAADFELARDLVRAISGERTGVLPEALQSTDPVLVQRGLRQSLAEAGRARRLCLIVDDLQWADELSATVLATLMYTPDEHAILLVVGLKSDIAPHAERAVETLRKLGRTIELHALSADEVGELLSLIFGDVPNVVRLAAVVHELGAGNPSQCLLVLEHLLRSGVARYEEGLWVLPAELSAQQAPPELARAAERRLALLGPAERELAATLSVLRGSFSLPLLLALGPQAGEVALHMQLEQLLGHGIVVRVESGGFRLASELVRDAANRSLTDGSRQALHRRVGELLASEATSSPRAAIEAGWHLLHGGQELRGAQALAAGALELLDRGQSEGDLFAAIRVALEVFERDPRASHDRIALRLAAVETARQVGAAEVIEHGQRAQRLLVQQTRSRLGKLLARLPLQLPPMLRAVVDPGWGVSPPPSFDLLRCTAALTRAAFATCNIELCRAALAPLQSSLTAGGEPATHAIARTLFARLHLLEGKEGLAYETGRQLWAELETSTTPSERPARMDLARTELTIPLCTLAALRGDRALLDELERAVERHDPRGYQSSTHYLSMVYHAARGEIDSAHRHRQQLESEANRTGTAWELELPGALILLFTYVSTGNAIGLKQTGQQLLRSASAWPSVLAYATLAQAGYLVLRGDARAALALEPDVLHQFRPGARHGWAIAHALIARAHNELGDFARAKQLCVDALARVAAGDRQFPLLYLELERQLALARVGLGQHTEAEQLIAQLLIDHAQAGGLTLGLLHEAGVRIARGTPQNAALARHLKLMDRCYRATRNPALVARSARLAEDAIAATQALEAPKLRPQLAAKVGNAVLKGILARVSHSEDRERTALDVMLEATLATGGLLYRADQGDLIPVAERVTQPTPPGLVDAMRRFLAEQEVDTLSLSGSSQGASDPHGANASEPRPRDEPPYEFVALALPANGGLVAIAALESHRGKPLPARAQLTQLLARSLCGQGRESDLLTATRTQSVMVKP
jgi:hypothetical protein